MNSETTQAIFIFYGVFLVAGFALAIPGTKWANEEKVVIYYGKSDLILSCVTLPIVVISLVDFSFSDWSSWVIKAVGVMLVLFSARLSFAANQNIGKTIVVVATKFMLVGLIAFCALLALEGIFGGIKAQKKRDYQEAAAKYITGALGVFGVYRLQKMIAKYVRGNPLQAVDPDKEIRPAVLYTTIFSILAVAVGVATLIVVLTKHN